MSKRLGIMQPYFFPYIGYFQAIHACDTFLLYEHVTFRKKSWLTRNRLLELNRGPVYIQIPVKDQSSYTDISEIKIDGNLWRKRIRLFIEHNYRKSPYFEETHGFVCSMLELPAESLHEFNSATIAAICTYLGIKSEIISDNARFLDLEESLKSSKINSEDDMITVEGKMLPVKTARIIRICRAETAEVYINPSGGTSLYSPEIFKDYGIDLRFMNTKDYQYNQGSEEFYKHLSILDVLYALGKSNTQQLLTQYELV